MNNRPFQRKLRRLAVACLTLVPALGCGGLSDQQMTQILSSVITSGLTAVVTNAVDSAAGTQP